MDKNKEWMEDVSVDEKIRLIWDYESVRKLQNSAYEMGRQLERHSHRIERNMGRKWWHRLLNVYPSL